jgi:hypothetical protein
MMSLWIGASSGNLFGNIDLRVVKAANRGARLACEAVVSKADGVTGASTRLRSCVMEAS